MSKPCGCIQYSHVKCDFNFCRGREESVGHHPKCPFREDEDEDDTHSSDGTSSDDEDAPTITNKNLLSQSKRPANKQIRKSPAVETPVSTNISHSLANSQPAPVPKSSSNNSAVSSAPQPRAVRKNAGRAEK